AAGRVWGGGRPPDGAESGRGLHRGRGGLPGGGRGAAGDQRDRTGGLRHPLPERAPADRQLPPRDRGGDPVHLRARPVTPRRIGSADTPLPTPSRAARPAGALRWDQLEDGGLAHGQRLARLGRLDVAPVLFPRELGSPAHLVGIGHVPRPDLDDAAAKAERGLAVGHQVLGPLPPHPLAGADVDVLAVGGDPDGDAPRLARTAPGRGQRHLALVARRLEVGGAETAAQSATIAHAMSGRGLRALGGLLAVVVALASLLYMWGGRSAFPAPRFE